MTRLLVLASLFALLSAAFALDCTGLVNGKYCTSSTSYEWCFGKPSSTSVTCNQGHVCLCGYTPEAIDPCGEEGNPPTDECYGSVPFEAGDAILSPRIIKATKNRGANATKAKLTRTINNVESTSASCAGITASSPTSPGSKKVVSYVTNWAQYRTDSCKFDISSIDGNIFTHINFAFGSVSPAFAAQSTEANDLTEGYAQITSLKTRFPHLKVMISFGGWGFNSAPATQSIFGDMASTAANRAVFIQSAIAWARLYNFDGVDIDWEYPGYTDQGGRAADKPNFSLLLQDFRAAIEAEAASSGRDKLLLTIACPTGAQPLAGYELDKIHPSLDWFNLMAYDIHAGYEPTTGFHTALYASDDNSIDGAIAMYKAAGVPASKIVMGLATYGRSWILANPASNGPNAAGAGSGPGGPCTAETGFISYMEIKDIIASGGTEYYDATAKSTYMVKGNQWISYDSPRSMKDKVDYINANGLGGGMIWALDLDTPQLDLQCLIAQNMFTNSASNPPPPPPVVEQPPPPPPPVVEPQPPPPPPPVVEQPPPPPPPVVEPQPPQPPPPPPPVVEQPPPPPPPVVEAKPSPLPPPVVESKPPQPPVTKPQPPVAKPQTTPPPPNPVVTSPLKPSSATGGQLQPPAGGQNSQAPSSQEQTQDPNGSHEVPTGTALTHSPTGTQLILVPTGGNQLTEYSLPSAAPIYRNYTLLIGIGFLLALRW